MCCILIPALLRILFVPDNKHIQTFSDAVENLAELKNMKIAQGNNFILFSVRAFFIVHKHNKMKI